MSDDEYTEQEVEEMERQDLEDFWEPQEEQLTDEELAEMGYDTETQEDRDCARAIEQDKEDFRKDML